LSEKVAKRTVESKGKAYGGKGKRAGADVAEAFSKQHEKTKKKQKGGQTNNKGRLTTIGKCRKKRGTL